MLIFSHLRVSTFYKSMMNFPNPEVFLQTGMDHMNMNFEYFQIQKWMLKTARAEKVDEKNGAICLVSMFPSWFMVLKLS